MDAPAPPAPPPDRTTVTTRPRVVGLVAAVAGAACLIMLLGLIASGISNSRAEWDQNKFHAPTIATFADELPTPHLADYRSATTPGYHLALAPLDRAGLGRQGLRAAGAVFTAALIGLLAGFAAGAMRPVEALALALPAAVSLYIVTSGAWLLPDNAAWLAVAATLAVCLRSAGTRGTALAGALTLLAVSFRQTHLWVAGVAWLAAWQQAADAGAAPLWRPSVSRVRALAVALLATAPAFVLVGAFALLWGGLTPPLFQGGAVDPLTGNTAPANVGLSLAMPALVLAMVGVIGAPMSSLIVLGRRISRPDALWLGAGALGAGLLAAAAPTSFSPPEGRFGGLWTIAGKLPTIADRSMLIITLAALGGAVIALWARSLPRQAGLILGAALLGFCLAHMPGAYAFQRYAEPMVLIVAILAGAEALRPGRLQPPAPHPPRLPRPPRLAWAGPIALTGLLGAITIMSLR